MKHLMEQIINQLVLCCALVLGHEPIVAQSQPVRLLGDPLSRSVRAEQMIWTVAWRQRRALNGAAIAVGTALTTANACAPLMCPSDPVDRCGNWGRHGRGLVRLRRIRLNAQEDARVPVST